MEAGDEERTTLLVAVSFFVLLFIVQSISNFDNSRMEADNVEFCSSPFDGLFAVWSDLGKKH